MALAAPVRHAAARATLTLPFRVPPQETFTIRQLSELCGMKETFIEEQFDDRKNLSGFCFNGGAGKRLSKRIPRAWAISFLVQHAQWDDEALTDAYRACLRHLPPEAILQIATDCQRLLAR